MESTTPTLHNSAKFGEIAPFVLMPGDPNRAEFIARKYLEKPRLVNDIRQMKAFSGYYHGKPVTVMASGMGTSSMSIYSYELYNFYGVETIIRVGSAGALQPDMELMDIIIAISASTDSFYPRMLDVPGTYSPTGSFELAVKSYEWARNNSIKTFSGMIFSGEAFYYDKNKMREWAKIGALAAEMETAALYTNAAQSGKKALSLLTVSDYVFKDGICDNETKIKGFDNMIKMALSLIEN